MAQGWQGQERGEFTLGLLSLQSLVPHYCLESGASEGNPDDPKEDERVAGRGWPIPASTYP